ncbi:MAG: 16S rRNA (cytidine(1402)-2'-O)-methyltransferase [Chloroflexota bacterium]
MSTLYLVATPIGNLEDITFRALKVLQGVQIIAAEDTRQTRKLLTHYQIHNRLISLFDQNERLRLPFLLDKLNKGDIALVSDGGTPALNDPGYELVNAAIQAGHTVSPIPGACAPISALVASGLPTDHFLYMGFLPRRSAERQQTLKQIVPLPYTLIFLEAPHRLLKTLSDLLTILGDRNIVVARELTKIHEEFFRSRISEAISHFQASTPRGEITLIVHGSEKKGEKWTEEELKTGIIKQLQAGLSAREASFNIAKQSGWSRKEIYHLAIQLQESQ